MSPLALGLVTLWAAVVVLWLVNVRPLRRPVLLVLIFVAAYLVALIIGKSEIVLFTWLVS